MTDYEVTLATAAERALRENERICRLDVDGEAPSTRVYHLLKSLQTWCVEKGFDLRTTFDEME